MSRLLRHDRSAVGELAQDSDVLENVASEHLRLMQSCGFFTSESEGRRIDYRFSKCEGPKAIRRATLANEKIEKR